MQSPKLITITIAVLAITACHPRPDRATLRTVMSLLERSEKVDSCLTVLKSIDTTALTRPADKARWSLLYAMALDKNYIDTTDLSVLQPAIDRYTHWTHLNRLDKFYTWYYKGRIEENAKIYDASLDSYLHAERYMGATDDVYRTRMYMSIARVFNRTVSRKDSYDASKKALKYARKLEDKTFYGIALCCCSDAAVYTSHPCEAGEYLKEYADNNSIIPTASFPLLLKSKFLLYLVTEQLDSLEHYLSCYLKSVNNPDLLQCANAYLKLKRYNDAARYLSVYEDFLTQDETPPYFFYALRTEVKEGLGDYKGALQDVHIHNALVSNAYLYNLDREIGSLKTKYHYKMVRNTIILISSFVVLLCLCGLLLYRNQRKKAEELLKGQVEDLRNAYERIAHLLVVGTNVKVGFEDSIDSLSDAILSLGNSLHGKESKSIIDSLTSIVRVSGAKRTVSLVSLFAAVHCARMFKVLQDKGLNDFETGYCFLLLMGIDTGKQEKVLNRWNLKNISLNIRKKIGITDKNEYLISRLHAIMASL